MTLGFLSGWDVIEKTIAHQTPQVMAVWEPMGPIPEELKLASIEPVAAPVGAA